MHSDPQVEKIESASPEELVLLLFEGAVRFGQEASAAIGAGNRTEGEQKVDRVRAIIRELDANLNPEAGVITRHLAAIYDYLLRRLSTPETSVEAIEEVIEDLQTLAQTWAVVVDRHETIAA